MDKVTYKNYKPYIIREFKSHYFKFDSLKYEYKELKKNNLLDKTNFEKQFINEILRLNKFITIICDFLEKDLNGISNGWIKMNLNEQKQFLIKSERTIERALRSIYNKLNDLKKFHKFNIHLIYKVAKKYEKILKQSTKYCEDLKQNNGVYLFPLWQPCPSHSIFNDFYLPLLSHIDELQDETVKVYTSIFRTTYPELARWELDYTKSKDVDSKFDQLMIGIKLGIILSTAIWLFLLTVVFKSANADDRFQIWKTLGLYVYSCVGNVLLFKITWTINVMIWTQYHINYISIFQFYNRTENSMKILNETLTQLVIFCLSLVFFFLGNVGTSSIKYRSLSFLCPISMLIASCLYSLYKVYDNGFLTNDSRGLFSLKVLSNCFIAPFVAISFRDVYVADVLTSFSKVLQDAVHALCWIFTGSFIYTDTDSDGDGTKYCPPLWIHNISSCVILFVLWIRFAQCLRVYRDTKLIFPHIFNAVKYLSSMSVVIYGLFREIDSGYIILIVIGTLYKWWWDVVMDWGLCDAFPRSFPFAFPYYTKQMFLRPSLMFHYPYRYYIAIFLDLILRFFWVTSLMPSETIIDLFGPMFSIYLGSFEILRRAMWGILRVEWEHIKLANKHEVGFNSILIGKKDISSNSITVPLTNLNDLKLWLPSTNIINDSQLQLSDKSLYDDDDIEEYGRKSVMGIQEIVMSPLSECSSKEYPNENFNDHPQSTNVPYEEFLDNVVRSNVW